MSTQTARGTFDVKITPAPADDYADGVCLGRLTLDKQFHGDLEATGKGQMLTGMSSTKGSAGYVAIERVTGMLAGKYGTFMLQHSGIADRGAQTLALQVIPDSATDELAGLHGDMRIIIENRVHSYELNYGFRDAADAS